MNKEEILQASRNENKNRDIYEYEVLKLGQRIGGLAGLSLAFVMMTVERYLELGMNYGYFIIILSAGAAMFTVKAIKLKRKHEIALAVLWTVMLVYAVTMYVLGLIG